MIRLPRLHTLRYAIDTLPLPLFSLPLFRHAYDDYYADGQYLRRYAFLRQLIFSLRCYAFHADIAAIRDADDITPQWFVSRHFRLLITDSPTYPPPNCRSLPRHYGPPAPWRHRNAIRSRAC